MYQNFIKPICDWIIALIAFPFFCIIWICVAIAIKLEDGGPVFYMAERIGKNSKKLMMFKFRSMKVNAENITTPDGSSFNAKDDPRETLIDYTRKINEELTRKRQEFNLPVAED